MQTINANTAAELILKLIKEKSWLDDPGTMTKGDLDSETEAVNFMQKLVTDGVESFDVTNASAQHIVAAMLHQLIDNLLHPENPLHNKTWVIDDSKPLDEQALTIIAAEILDSDWLQQRR